MKTSNNRSKRFRPYKGKKFRIKHFKNKKKWKSKKINNGIQGEDFKPRKLTKKEQAELRKRLKEG